MKSVDISPGERAVIAQEQLAEASLSFWWPETNGECFCVASGVKV